MRTLLRTSVVIALSGVAGARGVTGAMKAAALERSAKATTSFIVASCFLSLGSMLAFCTVTEACETQTTQQQAAKGAGYVVCRDRLAGLVLCEKQPSKHAVSLPRTPLDGPRRLADPKMKPGSSCETLASDGKKSTASHSHVAAHLQAQLFWQHRSREALGFCRNRCGTAVTQGRSPRHSQKVH